ncbi:CopG family protein [Sulfolobus monocaudavirus SMV1]|uniref:CopG family protein n=1 Tax=Sulfolobus monocaudavirus SMV1 TaxID=1351702 RepID=UPI0003D91B85|nr:CopG family protein [Sulfolobus monocaudavirus SMV1]CDF81364.1 CopG family protein [Sulfolobus monocaudavirus SMV1]
MITKTKKDRVMKVVMKKELYDQIVDTAKKLGISQGELLRQGALLYMSIIGSDGEKMKALFNTQERKKGKEGQC